MSPLYLCHPKTKKKIEKFNLSNENAFFGYFQEHEKTFNDYLLRGGRQFVAVGGDGTVFYMMNSLYQACSRLQIPFSEIQIGAIAFGSSNDFHKSEAKLPPAGNERTDFLKTEKHDLMRFQWNQQTWVSTLNASVGITAEANSFFNSDSFILNSLKKISMDLAILYSALRTLIGYRSCTISLDQAPYRLANLGIVKSRFFAGSFCYPDWISPNSGEFGVFLIPQKSKIKLILALMQLSRDQFSNIPQAEFRQQKKILISSEKDFFLEINGEVFKTKTCEIDLLPGAVSLCPLKKT